MGGKVSNGTLAKDDKGKILVVPDGYLRYKGRTTNYGDDSIVTRLGNVSEEQCRDRMISQGGKAYLYTPVRNSAGDKCVILRTVTPPVKKSGSVYVAQFGDGLIPWTKAFDTAAGSKVSTSFIVNNPDKCRTFAMSQTPPANVYSVRKEMSGNYKCVVPVGDINYVPYKGVITYYRDGNISMSGIDGEGRQYSKVIQIRGGPKK